MKTFTKFSLVVILFLVTAQSHAQWAQTAFKGEYVSWMKYANGKLFTYAVNLTSHLGDLYVSTDSGKTWNNSDSAGAYTQIFVHDITYDSAHSDYVLVASAQNGVYYSNDGYGWTNSGTNWSGQAIVYINGHDVLSNANDGPAISTDGGRSWNSSVAGLFAPYYDHSLVRVHDTLFLAQQGIPVFISTNGGSNWVRGDSDMIYFVDCFFEHKNVVYSGLYLAGVAYYQDRHWVFDSSGIGTVNDTWALSDAGDTLFCGGDSGVWMQTTGAWQRFSCGLPALTVLTLQHIGHYLFAGTDSGIYKIDLLNSGNCIANGVEPVIANNGVKIAPTVTEGVVTIYALTTPQKVEVINVSGQIKQTITNHNVVDVRSLPPGIYFLRITIGTGQILSDKIVRE